MTKEQPNGSASSSRLERFQQVTSTSDPSWTFDFRTLQAIPSATSSPGSAAGPTPSASPVGRRTGPSGPEAVPASLSAPLESRWVALIRAIYGRRSAASSTSAALQLSLESRLQARLGVNGSPEYALTWKRWAMPSGPAICALRASARRTSGNDSTGWPTPRVCSAQAAEITDEAVAKCWEASPNLETVVTRVLFTGWPTPNTPSGGRSIDPSKMSSTGVTLDGRKHTVSLEHVVRFAGWPTPMAGNAGTENYNPAGNTDSSRKTVELVGWNTPRATDGSNGGPNQTGGALPADAALAGWATPTTRDHKDGTSEGSAPVNSLLGRQVWLSPAQTEKRGALNPRFSLWLMGYPAAWVCCGVQAMLSVRSARKRSSKRT